MTNWKEDLYSLFDWITVWSFAVHILSWFTLPNLMAVFTLIWAIARAFESVFGKSIYEFFKKK